MSSGRPAGRSSSPRPRTAADVLGRGVLGAKTTITLTRENPADWQGATGRVDRVMLARYAFPPADRPRVFVCGSTPFVEFVAATLIDLGHEPLSIVAIPVRAASAQ